MLNTLWNVCAIIGLISSLLTLAVVTVITVGIWKDGKAKEVPHGSNP